MATTPPFELPINLGLNDGTYCPQRCIEVLSRFRDRTSLRHYTTPDNRPLREAVARECQVAPENIYLTSGSGPILKQCMTYVIDRAVRSSPIRIGRHLVNRTGYPVLTPRLTYFKVPIKAAARGLSVQFLPLEPEDDFRLDVGVLRERLQRRSDVLVYLANPNNPTGNVLITREQLVPLLREFPKATFWIDEAYVQYVDPAEHEPIAPLVAHHPNLMVSRTFSFAYGMAAVRIGYLVAPAELVASFEDQVVDYRLGMLQEQLGVAALEDPDHLPFIRAWAAEQRDLLRRGMANLPGLQTWPSQANFILCRLTNGWTGAQVADALLRRGIRIKTFQPVLDQRYDEYFRITLGTEEENRFLLDRMRDAWAELSGERQAASVGG